MPCTQTVERPTDALRVFPQPAPQPLRAENELVARAAAVLRRLQHIDDVRHSRNFRQPSHEHATRFDIRPAGRLNMRTTSDTIGVAVWFSPFRASDNSRALASVHIICISPVAGTSA